MLPKRLGFLKGSGGQAGLLPAVRLEPLAVSHRSKDGVSCKILHPAQNKCTLPRSIIACRQKGHDEVELPGGSSAAGGVPQPRWRKASCLLERPVKTARESLKRSEGPTGPCTSC